MNPHIDIVFDGPAGHESGRFVETEDSQGRGIKAGEWIDRGNGLWALRIPDLAARVKELEANARSVAKAHAAEVASARNANTQLLQALRDRGTHTEICRSQQGEARRRRFWTETDAETCNCVLGRMLKGTPSKWSKRPAANGTASVQQPAAGENTECDRCDGCGWHEGGATLQTTCEKCGGTGVVQVQS